MPRNAPGLPPCSPRLAESAFVTPRTASTRRRLRLSITGVRRSARAEDPCLLCTPLRRQPSRIAPSAKSQRDEAVGNRRGRAGDQTASYPFAARLQISPLAGQFDSSGFCNHVFAKNPAMNPPRLRRRLRGRGINVAISKDDKSARPAGADPDLEGQKSSITSPISTRSALSSATSRMISMESAARPCHDRAGGSKPGTARIPLPQARSFRRVGQFSKAGLELAACGNTGARNDWAWRAPSRLRAPAGSPSQMAVRAICQNQGQEIKA